ncbi:MAG TPA: winged helix-turn-helix domain-containing protein [Candidatus Limnocylindria bacterium]|nr:winged helix-turn-helix domain-containing protein [Candidatus Limnocylindria bacterium]
MKNSAQFAERFRFGDFEVDLHTGDLRKHGHRIRLQEKPFQILSLLLERAGEVVTRDELRQRLWPADTFVDFDANLNTSLNRLRQALGDTANEQIFIRTVPRQGYRFIAAITKVEQGMEGYPPAPPSDQVGAIVEHAPATNPQARLASFSSPGLRYILVAAVLVTVTTLGIAYFWWTGKSAEAGRSTHRGTILVMPFEDLSGDPSQDYLSDGLTDEMITRLGEISPEHLNVIARSTAMQYKRSHKTIEQVAHEQHVDYILEGSFRRQGDKVRITAQLFNARDHGSLWTEAYDRNASDLFAIQREVADRIAQSLSLELLPPAANSVSTTKPVGPEAYDAYLKGLFELNKRTPADLQKSIAYFGLATQKDTEFAPAYAALAYSYNVAAGWTYLSPTEAYPKAKVAAQKALVLDSTLADSHFAYAEVLHDYDWDWSGAEREYLRGLELNPSSAVGHKLYAEYLTHAGRHQEALGEIRKAQRFDPASLVINSFVCFVYMHAHEYESAMKECKKDLDLDPRFMPAHDWLGDSYLFTGHYEEAAAEFKKALELSGNANYFLTALAMTYGLEGKKEEARKILAELKQRATQTYVSPFGLADVYIGLGDKKQALAMLEQAGRERSVDLMFLADAPEFDALRDDPGFKSIIARIGFPDSAMATPLASKEVSSR